jgi:hypothetical protein
MISNIVSKIREYNKIGNLIIPIKFLNNLFEIKLYKYSIKF